MTYISPYVLWTLLQYGDLVAAASLLPVQSRVFLNATSSVEIAPSTSSTTSPTETHPSSLGHGPGQVTATSPVITVVGGHTVTDGRYVDNMGDTVTVTTSFSLSPVGVSPGFPTITESTLPWTGRILTDPGAQTTSQTSSMLSGSSLMSTESSFTSTTSNSSIEWSNTTSSSTTSSWIVTKIPITPTSQVVSNLSITLATPTISLTSDRGNLSRTLSTSATYTLFSNTSDCSTLSDDEPVTVWSILPNTTTTTMTITGNLSTTLLPQPEFTPPVYCPTTTSLAGNDSDRTSAPAETSTVPYWILPPHQTTVTLTDSAGIASTVIFTPGFTSPAEVTQSPGPAQRTTITSITTSKNGVTEITSATLPNYGDPKTDKVTTTPTLGGPDTFQWIPQTMPPRTTASPVTTIFAADPAATTPLTETVNGITIIAGPSKVTIGGQTIDVKPTPQTIVEAGETFTVLPNEIDGPSVIISLPTFTSGGVFVESPHPTTIDGVSLSIGGSSVVVEGTTFTITPNAPQKTITAANGETIVIGPSGVAFDHTTITPLAAIPIPPAPTDTSTNIAIVGGQIITAIGSSIVVVGGQTITYGSSIPATTLLFNNEPLTISPSGIIFHGTTIGGPGLSPSSSQIGVLGGLSITEIGSTLAVIAGTTFTIGPSAHATTATILGQTITAGPSGLIDGGFTWNPAPAATRTITGGGITFSEIGSNVVVIGSKTYTIGPGAIPTTDVYAGKTISIGPGGIGFEKTTFSTFPTVTGSVASSDGGDEERTGGSVSQSAAATTSGQKKSFGTALRPSKGASGFGVLAACFIGVVGFL